MGQQQGIKGYPPIFAIVGGLVTEQKIRVWLFITVCALVLPMYLLYQALENNEQRLRDEQLHQYASLSMSAAERNLAALEEHLVALRNLMTFQPDLTRQQFDQFNAQSKLSGYGIVVYGWLPKTLPGQSEAMIEQARKDGIFDFRLSRVSQYEELFPIYYSASGQMNGLSLGVNLAAIPSIRKGMVTAVNSNRVEIVISENMGFDDSETPEMRLLLPVFSLRENSEGEHREVGPELRGYVSAMVHFDEAMQILLGPVLNQRQNLGLEIYRQGSVEPELLFSSLHRHTSDSRYRAEFMQQYGSWTLKYRFIDLSPEPPWWLLSRPSLIVGSIALVIWLFLSLLRHAVDRRIRAEELAKEQGRSLAVAQSEYHNLFEKVVEGVYSATLEGRFLKVNPSLAKAFGYDDPAQMQQAVEHIGRQLHREQQSYQSFMQTLLEKKEVYNYEWEGIDRYGNSIWLSENAYLNAEAEDRLVYQGTLDVITERKFNEQRLNYQANHDPLTGLLNRSACQKLLENHLQQQRWGQVLFIDLDGFKKINDTYGHGNGDLFLQEIAQRLQQVLRQQDSIARIGGDEFVIYLAGEMSNLALQQLTDRLQLEVARPVMLDGCLISLQVSASIGVTFLGPHYQNADDILRDADLAMYEVKKNGKAAHQVYSLELHKQIQQQTEFENHLHSALGKQEFSLNYQPVVSIEDSSICHSSGPERNSVCGFEVLLRWYNPQLGQVSPERFIPLAEQQHLMPGIGLWIVEQALKGFNQLQACVPDKPITININLSPRQLHDDSLIDALPDLLQQAGVNAHSIRFELTESALDMDEQAVVGRLTALRDMGFKIYIDDFGTGYSSLKRLVEFPIDGIKVDRSFVHQLEEDSSKQAMIEVIVHMARLLNLKVVAEGVETQEQKALLQAAGCRFAQGYLFSKPLPEEAAGHFLRQEKELRKDQALLQEVVLLQEQAQSEEQIIGGCSLA